MRAAVLLLNVCLMLVACGCGSGGGGPQVFVINGQEYRAADPRETIDVPFKPADAAITASSYQGYVLVNVTGVGQAYGATYNDAFYLYTAPFDPPQNGWDGGFYQLAFKAATLTEFDAGAGAWASLYGTLPPYNPSHEYTVILDSKVATPGKIHFGVTDGGYSDNSGAFRVTITQLVRSP